LNFFINITEGKWNKLGWCLGLYLEVGVFEPPYSPVSMFALMSCP